MQLEYIAVTAENSAVFHQLMQAYAQELDAHQGRQTDPQVLRRWTESIIEKQCEGKQCLKLCCDASEVVGFEVIGFLYGKIDQGDEKGFTKPGFGYVMEFYVRPECRRTGYGRQMFAYLANFFAQHQAAGIYLTADPVTGKPFWEAMGFVGTGELSPRTGLEIYECACCAETAL